MAITHTFKGSRDSYGYGYFAYIEDGQLVIGEDWPREGGVTYRGTYRDATEELEKLMEQSPRLYNSIVKYYADKEIKRAKEIAFNPSGVMWKVKLHMNNGAILNALTRGLCESGVIAKIMNNDDKVCIIQTQNANVLGVRSEQVCAIEFVEEF